MIYSIEGKLIRRMPMEVFVEVGGICYMLSVPLSTSSALPEEGSQIRLFTIMMIREENPELYGFATEKEWKIFQKMILLPGVGPKLALRILSRLSPDEILSAVVSGDVEFLKKTPGIGKKTAERLVLELKDHLKGMEPIIEDVSGNFVSEAIEALTVLGYRRNDAQQIVRRTASEIGKKPESLESFLREILKRV
ncbi:MAG: Holliday junction branch migration protein RuvA [Candidatus Omnitrophica bacterium]|nr:Holliday junction branch migration protein RuvA [Candidatus Omnitrophota bacterium]MCM8828333.1 Holliday junction branch migration protein RuvA [Candidatus Omnitrophota bacterium]